MNTQVTRVKGYSLCEMVYHCEQILFKIKAMMDQIIIEKKNYEQNTQWVKERRKYSNDETFAVKILVLVYYLLGSMGQNPFNKMDRN